MSEAAPRGMRALWVPPVLARLGEGRLRAVSDAVASGRTVAAARLAPMVSWGRARLSIVSRPGWVCLLGLGAAMALALMLGWRELWAGAFVLVVLFLGAVGFVLGRAAHEVTIALASTQVVVGEQAVGRLRVANPGARSLRAADVELPVGRALATFGVPRLGAGEELEEIFTIPTQRRAVLQLGPARAVQADPLGLLRRVRPLSEPDELYVHPRIVSLSNASTGLLRDLEGLARQAISNDDISFHTMREYVPGDDRRHIHWKSSARAQQLMVRQYEETRRSQLAVLLAARPGEYADPDEFELAVSVVGSIGVRALSEGKAMTMLGPHRAMARHTRGQLLDGLSAVELDERARPVEEQAGTVAAHAPGASLVIFVAGSRVADEQLFRASARLPLAAQRVAITVDATAAPRRRSSGGLTLLTIPALDDLSTALRRGIG